MMNRSGGAAAIRVGVLLALFLATFALRAYHPVSRERPWLVRSRAFNAALDAHNWAHTYQHYHPGLTIMVFAGLGLRFYQATAGTPLERLFDEAAFPFATPLGRRTTAAVIGLAAAFAALACAIVLVLRRLAGWRVALAAGGLICFAPFELAHGRCVHVDALLSAFMLLSALLLLLALETRRRLTLVASGFAAGLAVLTKTPALFLVPFTGLALIAYTLRATWDADGPRHQRTPWVTRLRSGVLAPGLLWVLVAAAAFLLWPAMWVTPLAVLSRMIGAVHLHMAEPHKNPVFFHGKLYLGAPPSVWFYPAVLAFSSTFVTLPLMVLAVGQYTVWRRWARLRLAPTAFWLLIAYIGFFVLQMSLGAKQLERYVLPAHLALLIVAAVGLVGAVDLVLSAAGSMTPRRERAAATIAFGLTIALQAAVALSYAPNYGVHHNHLLGGNRVAAGWFEIADLTPGLTDVADYLGRQPDADALRLSTNRRMSLHLAQYFSGQLLDGGMSGDYTLFDLTTMQRRLHVVDWAAAWNALHNRPPQLVVSFDGVEVLWLYAMRPEPGRATLRIEHGWDGWLFLAWVWTAALAGGLGWALSRRRRAATMATGVKARRTARHLR